MKITNLDIKNFKGITEIKLVPIGLDMDIRGDNATGKTSVYDAFLWLLFSKDSQGKTAFEVKPLDADGNSKLNGESVEVYARIEHNGESCTLLKRMSENWVRRRGSSQSELNGHTTEYAVNGVPVTQTAYKASIKELMDEGLFRLLTDVRYFNEQLDWKQRRAMLFELAGEPDDVLIAAKAPEIAEMLSKKGRLSVTDYKKAVQTQIRQLNDALKQLPARIDEVGRMIKPINYTKADANEARRIENQIDEYRQLMNVTGDSREAELKAQLRVTEADIRALDTTRKAMEDDLLRKLRNEREAKCAESRAKLADLASDMRDAEYIHKEASKDISRCEANLSRLRDKWNEVNETEFNGRACPMCGRDYENADVMEFEFNAHKQDELAKIEEEAAELSRFLEVARVREDESKKRLAGIQSAKKTLEDHINVIESETITVNAMPDYPAKMGELTAQRKAIEDELKEIAGSRDNAKNAILAKIQEQQAELARIKRKKDAADQNALLETRMEELTAQKLASGKELEECEQLLIACETYSKVKASLCEDGVNALFNNVRFKLYDMQINGGVAETCECTVGGVPYSDLNNAAKINAGIEIINAFIYAKGISAPLFIDNAEAVTAMAHTPAQTIRLIVDERYSSLNIEYARNNEEAAD